ncbi:MAG: 50S ribosomal protein L28 [Parcubacteria group bacterium]|nr:MAG: 50S ribosomal protein L28 [Parcubacteria group bacterium]
MAKICSICHRKAVTGHSRSHSNIATKRLMSINIQSKKVDGVKKQVCTSCIRSINKKVRQTTKA